MSDPRPAGLEDAEALAALHAAAFERPWSTAEFATLLDSPGALALVLPDGFILIRAVAGEAEIVTLAVSPSARRAGLGRRLVETATAAALAAGAETMFLEVAEDNDAALGLYRALGFETVGRRRGYYAAVDGPRRDALVMRLALNS